MNESLEKIKQKKPSKLVMTNINTAYNIDVLKPEISYIVAEKDLTNKAKVEKGRPKI